MVTGNDPYNASECLLSLPTLRRISYVSYLCVIAVAMLVLCDALQFPFAGRRPGWLAVFATHALFGSDNKRSWLSCKAREASF